MSCGFLLPLLDTTCVLGKKMVRLSMHARCCRARILCSVGFWATSALIKRCIPAIYAVGFGDLHWGCVFVSSDWEKIDRKEAFKLVLLAGEWQEI